MEEFESLGQMGFELKWLKNGELILSHRIIRDLRSQGRNQNEKLTVAARREYPGALFPKFFSYWKNGSSLVLRDAHSIARRYTRLQADPTHVALATTVNGHTNIVGDGGY